MGVRLALHGISKRYKAINALKNICLTLDAGEFLAVQGPSGSGKSSLLNICSLIDSPCEGQLSLNGQIVSQLGQRKRCDYRRRDIGIIFQRHQLIPAMTVFENIAYPLLLNQMRPTQIKNEVNQFIDKIGLNHRKQHLPKQLSGGERQRVGIARALIKKPQLVIADEPSASLDHKNAQTCLSLMRELNQQAEASFLIASHDPFVIKFCDRKIELVDGCLEPCA